MLTLDDCNTIYNKYEFNNFFYKLSKAYNKPVDFLNTKLMIDTSDCSLFYGLVVTNCFWTGGYYVKSKTTGEYYEIDLHDPYDEFGLNIKLDFWEDYDLYLHMAVDKDINLHVMTLEWHPVSSLTMSVYDNGEFIPKKIYLDFHGHPAPETVSAGAYDKGYDISLLPTLAVNQDDKGYYINAVVDDFMKSLFAIEYDGFVFYGKLNHLKRLPVLGVDTLYKGTSQKIRIKTSDDDYVSMFQAYYQGRKLQNNIIDLPYDVEDFIEITVDLLDSNYPTSTLKLKVATEVFEVNSISDLNYAIENNILNFKINIFDISGFELEGCTIHDSNIGCAESTFENATFENCTFTDQGENIFNHVSFDNCNLLGASENISKFNNVNITNCTIQGIEFHITGVIKNSTLNSSLIISDGFVELTNNNFEGKYEKDYFPSFLYLTGTYSVTQNTFTLDDEWEELAFNMCVIKTTTFAPREFLNTNTVNMNIIYGSEEPNTFYYNLVDDDKIRAVRL